MAFIDTDLDKSGDFPAFYNVFKAVGMGCPNEKEDVMLVQFFLKRIYMSDMMKNQTPKGKMEVDGKCGPITRNWILKFQIDMINGGLKCYPDGIVNKAGNEKSNWEASNKHTVYTIRLMNNGLKTLDPNLYKTLPVNPIVPIELRLAFLQMHAEGPAMN